MQGFFDLDEQRRPELARIRKSGPLSFTCDSCGLYKRCRSPKIAPTGQGEKKILIIAEAPGEQEDIRGTQLIGPAGQILRQHLSRVGIDLDRDCRKTNILQCRPPGNRKPEMAEILACWNFIEKEVKAASPKLVILLGATPMLAWLMKRGEDAPGALTRWRGCCIPDREWNCWVGITWHPSYILRMANRKFEDELDEDEDAIDPKIINRMYQYDFQYFLESMNEPLPSFDPETCTFDLPESETEIMDALFRLLEEANQSELPVHMAVDFETTGLKPHKRGHRILSCALCWHCDSVLAFPVTEPVKAPLDAILQHPNVIKMASNLQMEDTWAERILGHPVVYWGWDTSIAAHLLDNRRAVAGLKFLAFTEYGIRNYAADLEKNRKSSAANAFNTMSSVPVRKLLRYNAMDSLITYNLAFRQMERLDYDPQNLPLFP